MRTIDQDTDKPYHLEMTPELKADLEVYQRSHCEHTEFEVRQRKDGGGASHYYRQCVGCGKSVGSALGKSPEWIKAPPWKDDHQIEYEAGRKARLAGILQKHVRRQKHGDEGFKRKYDVYLTTPEWHRKRAKVLRRSRDLCEGCLEHKATQVHHLTYRHIFEEFMFELVAVCDECHVRLHAEKHEGAAELEDEWMDGYPCEGCRYGSEKQDRRWCSVLDQYAADALAPGGDCGPGRTNFQPLK